MGESACLIQTFSHTSSDTSHEAKEGNPIHALGQSISFGRFLSESLSWEKWSSFSHNRHLEEVEKYSKPGSVAQKKAYFEAHYKKIAAQKAAALLEQENAGASSVCEPESKDEVHDGASPDSELEGSNSHGPIDEPHETEVPNIEEAFIVDANECDANVEMDAFKTNKVEEAAPIIEDQVLVENTVQFESTNHLGDSENHIKVTGVELSRTNQKELPLKENLSPKKELASTTKIKAVVSSSKPSVNSRASKLPFSPAKYATPVHPRKESSATPRSTRFARDSIEKKKSTPKSIHMSLNFAPFCAGETKKISSPIIQKIENSRARGSSSKASNDCSTPTRTPARASVNGLPKDPSVTPKSENRRTKTTLAQAFSGSRKVDAKWQSLSVDRSKSVSALGNKAQSSVASSPFNFRTDERATKRKQKLEEKFSAKESQKVQLQSKSKEKAENELKKLRQSLGFKARPMPDFYREIDSSKNQIKKIPLTRPRSPKLGRKLTTSAVQETSSLPPRGPSVNSDGSKHVIEKNNRTPTHPLNSIPKKNTHENASPNIQR